jgi:hypothetical protein
MSLLIAGALVLSAALSTQAGAQETRAAPRAGCTDEPRELRDDAACTIGYAPPSICDVTAEEPRPESLGLPQLLGCANDLQNCACSLIGAANCTSINTAGRVVLGEVPSTQRRARYSLRRDPVTGEIVVMLDRETANEVSHAATYVDDAHILDMRLEYHTNLYRLTSAVALIDGARRLADEYTAASSSSGRLLEEQLRELWTEIAIGLHSCHAAEAHADPEAPDSAAFYFRNNMVCAFRAGSTLAGHPVFQQWPGCSCGGGRGRMLGGLGTCITSHDPVDRFEQEPIDQRMPDMLSGFVRLLESRTGFRVREVVTIGCGFQRFETGTAVRGLAKMSPERRALRASHISDHSRASACDLAAVTFRIDDCHDFTWQALSEAPGRANVRPYYDALKGYLNARGLDADALIDGHQVVREGAGVFYRRLERDLSARPWPTLHGGSYGARGSRDEQTMQVRLGVLLRNALVDSGFVVYDPTTNSGHRDHFHFEIPASDADLAAMRVGDPDAEAARARDELLNRYLWRASGMTGAASPDAAPPVSHR